MVKPVKPPVLKSREVVALLKRLGFREIRQRGSHKQFRHPDDGRTTTVPFHGAGRDIAPSLLRQIARDIRLSVNELLESDRANCPRARIDME